MAGDWNQDGWTDLAVSEAGDRAIGLRMGSGLRYNPPRLPPAWRGVPYDLQSEVRGGTTPVWTWAATLPPGMSLSLDGRLFGVPSTSGTFTIGVRAADADGCRGLRRYRFRVGTD